MYQGCQLVVPPWGQGPWGTMEVQCGGGALPGGLWEEWAPSVLFVCLPTSRHA